MRPSAALLFSIFLYLINSASAQGGQTCNATSKCASSSPCCSEFGFCGTDTFCLGGCNPFSSYEPTSCRPNPVCKDGTYAFQDNSRILSNATLFDGNASAYDWVVDKGNIMNNNGELGLILTETNGGTRLSSTRYVHYGTITATLKSGRWGGVVTAFITMSDVKDEIDWEFPGNATTEAQTNFFWQGNIPPTTAGETEKGLSDTYSNYHDYTIDWQPDALTFLIDNNVVRTVQKTDDQYPSTPSRVQLSLWPAGIASSAPGTVTWAGGMIDWTDPDYVSAGQFSALVKSVTIKCADPQQAGTNTDVTSYTYGDNTTSGSPDVGLSNSSTLVNGAEGVVGSLADSRIKVALGVVVGAIMVLNMF